MRTFLKYLLPIIILILLILSYFRYTESGQKNAYSLASMYASYKAGIDIEIKKVNFNQYPFIKATLLIETRYNVTVEGIVKNKNIDLQYHLNSKCYKSDICSFDDTISVKGKIKGWKKHIQVTGAGHAIDGNVSYIFTKETKRFSDIHFSLHDVNSSKLFSMLDQEAFFKGKANAKLDFDVIEENHKRGSIQYEVNTSKFYDMHTYFQTHVVVKDNTHIFTMQVMTPHAILKLSKGEYDQSNKHARAHFTLDISDLSKLQKITHTPLIGNLHTQGEIKYDKLLKIKGSSHDIGGILNYLYDGKRITFTLKDISLPMLMTMLKTKPLLDTNMTGKATFNPLKNELQLNAQFPNAKIRPSKLTKMLQNKFALSVEDEIFNQSNIALTYKNDTLTSKFKLANKNIQLILNNTHLNVSNNTLSSILQLKTPKHSIEGKVYAKIDDIEQKKPNDIYLRFDGFIEKYYQLRFNGLVNETFMNMKYQLSAARLPGKKVTIIDDINLSGHINGSLSHLLVSGSGTAMEGNLTYSGIKRKESYENLMLDFKNIHALKLFTLLNYPTLPSGKADIQIRFSHIDNKTKNGSIDFTLKNGHYATLPLFLHTKAKIKNKYLTFIANAKLSTAEINLSKGAYNFENNQSKAFYTIHTKNLAPLSPLIGKYKGPFNSSGEITYSKYLKIRGLSHTFGGMIDYLYKDNMLYMDLEKVSLKRVLGLYDSPKILDAKVNGNINFDHIQKKFLVRADLNNTRFLNSDLVQSIYKNSGVNMLKEVFPNSQLRASYQHKIVQGTLLLQNKKSHFYLKRAHINTEKNNINALFGLHMQGQEFSGKVYGSLSNPKVKLNMKKLIRYQMDKQLDSVIGKGNRKLIESMPMGEVAKDVATEVGGGFLDMFF